MNRIQKFLVKEGGVYHSSEKACGALLKIRILRVLIVQTEQQTTTVTFCKYQVRKANPPRL